jgi:hypothetical protein
MLPRGVRAAGKNPSMLLFLVDPKGRSILPKQIAAIDAGEPRDRSLKDTFAGNEAERRKLMSFFRQSTAYPGR